MYHLQAAIHLSASLVTAARPSRVPHPSARQLRCRSAHSHLGRPPCAVRAPCRPPDRLVLPTSQRPTNDDGQARRDQAGHRRRLEQAGSACVAVVKAPSDRPAYGQQQQHGQPMQQYGQAAPMQSYGQAPPLEQQPPYGALTLSALPLTARRPSAVSAVACASKEEFDAVVARALPRRRRLLLLSRRCVGWGSGWQR